MNHQNRYKVVWNKPELKNGFYQQQEVVVYGIDNVQHIIEHMVPKNVGWDVFPM